VVIVKKEPRLVRWSRGGLLAGLIPCSVACLEDPYYIDDALAQESEMAADAGANSNSSTTDQQGSELDPTEPLAPEPTAPRVTGPDTTLTNEPSVDDPGASDSADDAGSSAPPGSNETQASDGMTINGATVNGLCWPFCGDVARDGNFDGWNIDNDRSCLVDRTSIAADAETCDYDDRTAGLSVDGECYAPCPGPYTDGDGDGWGTENRTDCVVAGSAVAGSATPCPHP
jgi:hypothetical protein